MRKSEIDAKIAVVLRKNTTNLNWQTLSIANAASVGREVAIEIARALGVSIEEDDTLMPNYLREDHWQSSTDTASLVARGDSYEVTVSVGGNGSMTDKRRVAEHVIRSYNEYNSVPR